jgi:hypothetical protein
MRMVKIFVMAAACAGLSGAAYAQDTMTIQGSGSSAFETPPVSTGGVAHGTCTLTRSALQMACTARVHNLVDLTAAHIHVGGPGVAGPVAMNIPDLPLRISNDFTLTWVWRESDLILRPAQGINSMTDLFESCSSGACYLNFHTTANPGGEIRINLCPTSDSRGANPFFAINVCAPSKP